MHKSTRCLFGEWAHHLHKISGHVNMLIFCATLSFSVRSSTILCNATSTPTSRRPPHPLCHAFRLTLGAMTSFWPLVPRHPSHLLYGIVLSTPKLLVSLHGVHAFLREGEHPASSQAGHMHGHWNHCIPTTPLLLGPYTQKRGHMSGHSPAETLPIPTITLATHTCSTSV